MRLTVGLTVLLSAVLVGPGPALESEPTYLESGEAAIVRDGTPRAAVWAQLTSGQVSYPASRDLATGTGTECADDFFSEEGASIEAIEWWGKYASGEPPVDEAFAIRFYTDVEGAQFDAPGVVLYDEICEGYWTESPGGWYIHYSLDLPSPFVAEPATTYWFSVQRTSGVAEADLWYWMGCDATYNWGACADMRWGTSGEWSPFWQHDPWGNPWAELSFVLHDETLSPVESVGWGRIKSLFR